MSLPRFCLRGDGVWFFCQWAAVGTRNFAHFFAYPWLLPRAAVPVTSQRKARIACLGEPPCRKILFLRGRRAHRPRMDHASDSHLRYPVTILPVTRERWAQIGITAQFLIVVRTLGEIFRLRHLGGVNFSVAGAMPYVSGALIAGCCCWVSVSLYFFRRYALSAWIALAAVVILLAYKLALIGR